MKSGRAAVHLRLTRSALIGFLTVLSAAAHSADAQKQGAGDLGRKVYTEIAQPSCAICHTLKDAGSAGTIGPALDELKPDATRVATAVRNGVGVMPAYAATLSKKQIEALAQYVSRAAGAR